MTDTDAITRRLGALFIESLHIEAPSPDTDLFETGILDSLQLVELLAQLEQRFSFKIKIDDIDLDDLRTLARIAGMVAARTAGAGTQTAQLLSLEVRHGSTNQEENHGLRSRVGSSRDSVSGESHLPARSLR